MTEFTYLNTRRNQQAEGVRQHKMSLQDNRTSISSEKLTDRRTTQLAHKANNTGLPDNLKHGIESLSGMSMDNVKVHYNSSKPAQLNAHAYAQGTNIHLAPGQEKHLPHEAWHVVQQAQGRVRPTMQMKACVPVNDDKGLEYEADVMGEKASRLIEKVPKSSLSSNSSNRKDDSQTTQRRVIDDTANKPAFQLDEKRPAAVSQRKPQALADNSLSPLKPIQFKKTTKPDDVHLVKLADQLVQVVDPDVIKNFKTDDAKGKRIWDKLNSEYDTCKSAGDKYWASLQTNIEKYNDKNQKEGLVQTLKGKKEIYQSTFSKNYSSSKPEKLPGTTSNYGVKTIGYVPDPNTNKPEAPKGVQKGNYSNEYDIDSGKANMKWNFGDEDKAKQAGIGLKNSEILYRQHRMAAEEHYKTEQEKEERVKAATKRISKITRSDIVNNTTLSVIYMAYPSDVVDYDIAKKSTEKWTIDSDDFKAILGTPNANSAAYLLIDHMDEMEKTIDNMEAKGIDNLEINLKDI